MKTLSTSASRLLSFYYGDVETCIFNLSESVSKYKSSEFNQSPKIQVRISKYENVISELTLSN